MVSVVTPRWFGGLRPRALRRMVYALALAALAGGCASTGATPRPFPAPAGSVPPPEISAAPEEASSAGRFDGYALTATALALRGTPYRNGGTDPNGFDCSGFTQYVFNEHGVRLPREVKEQFQTGANIKAEDVQAGDLLFFATNGGRAATHVGIAIDGDQFIHAPSSTGVVRVERLSQPYWAQRFVGAKRIQ